MKKKIIILLIAFQNFNTINAENSISVIGENVNYTLSKKILFKIKKHSQNSYKGFRINKKVIDKLKNGKSIEIRSYAKRRILKSNSIIEDKSNFFVISPRIFDNKIFNYKNLKLSLYYLIDEDNQYIQTIFLDTNCIDDIFYISGYANPKDLISFNKFKKIVNFSDDTIITYNYDTIINSKNERTLRFWLNIQETQYSSISNSFKISSSKFYFIFQDLNYFDRFANFLDYRNRTNLCENSEMIKLNDRFCFFSKKIDLANTHNKNMRDSFIIGYKKLCLDSIGKDSLTIEQRIRNSLIKNNINIIYNITTKCWNKDSLAECNDYKIENNISNSIIYLQIHKFCTYLCPYILAPHDNLFYDNLYQIKYNKIFKTFKIKIIKRECMCSENKVNVMELISIP